MKIAIDFDGVLHGYSKGFQDGEIYDPPVPGAAEAMKKMKEQGHYLYIFTTRTNKIFRKKGDGKDEKYQENQIKEWMAKYDIPYDKIWTFGKPMADLFIDDRAINFAGNWDDTFETVTNFKTWLEK
jgi:ribonucleotide monophosphatase NagD (HAD superfamily)